MRISGNELGVTVGCSYGSLTLGLLLTLLGTNLVNAQNWRPRRGPALPPATRTARDQTLERDYFNDHNSSDAANNGDAAAVAHWAERSSQQRVAVARVTNAADDSFGDDDPNIQLPRSAGQVWRRYNIRTFSSRAPDQANPEQVIVDWILRETGTDAWFGRPTAVLSASRNEIRVYHTPAVQAVVKAIIDRFLRIRSDAHGVVVRVVTVGGPDWRSSVLPLMQPVPTQTPGIEAWVVSRENATVVMNSLRQRRDFQEHSSPNLAIFSGQTHTLQRRQPRMYRQTLQSVRSPLVAGHDLAQLDEGFSLQISPLVSADGRQMDAVVNCAVDQIEGFSSVWVNVPTGGGGSNRQQQQIPQLSSWRLHERFRWPVNDVLVISRGLVATPGPTAGAGRLQQLMGKPARANALLFLESRPEIRSGVAPAARLSRQLDAAQYRGRY